MNKILIIMTFLNSLFGTTAQKSKFIKALTPASFKEAIANKKVQLIDVRTAQEYNSGHIKGALNIDYYDKSNFTSAIQKLDKEAAVYLYCRSGNRSGKAAKKLTAAGFKEIYDLQGGYLKWK